MANLALQSPQKGSRADFGLIVRGNGLIYLLSLSLVACRARASRTHLGCFPLSRRLPTIESLP